MLGITATTSELEGHAALAMRAAAAAARVIDEALSSGDWAVRVKADSSPVTDVDIAAEKAIRSLLEEATPEAAFFGEETGQRQGQGRLRWLVDPIDGTKSFVRGLPFYSSQIALEIDGVLAVGVSNAPAFGECLVARADGAVHLNGEPVESSSVDAIDDAFLSSGNLASLAADAERWRRYGEIVARARRVRGYGDFCHYHQLCRGGADLVIESDVNILDIAALTVAVRAAGGVITDIEGEPIGDGTTSILAASTDALHAAAVLTLQGEAVRQPSVG